MYICFMNTMYTIYEIKVKYNAYVGATMNFSQRLIAHKFALNRMMRVGKLEYRTFSWKLFNVNDLIKYGYSIKVYCYCEDVETATVIEETLIAKYKRLDQSLNNSDRSGLPRQKKKLNKIERLEYKKYKFTEFMIEYYPSQVNRIPQKLRPQSSNQSKFAG